MSDNETTLIALKEITDQFHETYTAAGLSADGRELAYRNAMNQVRVLIMESEALGGVTPIAPFVLPAIPALGTWNGNESALLDSLQEITTAQEALEGIVGGSALQAVEILYGHIATMENIITGSEAVHIQSSNQFWNNDHGFE